MLGHSSNVVRITDECKEYCTPSRMYTNVGSPKKYQGFAVLFGLSSAIKPEENCAVALMTHASMTISFSPPASLDFGYKVGVLSDPHHVMP